jgi:hypothetical protein
VQGRAAEDTASLNDQLARTVPSTARVVLQVGAHRGWLGDDLKRDDRTRVVLGVQSLLSPPPPSTAGVDEVFELDIERQDPPLERGSVDSIVYADILPRLRDPLGMLERHRRLLSAGGTISCSVPNAQHRSVVAQLLRGSLPYRQGTLLDPSYVRLFTFAGAVQLLLDAGYAPDTVGRIEETSDDTLATVAAGAPLFELLGVGTKDAERDLRTTHMLLRGLPLPDPGPPDESPITFVACVNDDAQLEANLLASPCLRAPSPHELLIFRDCASAGEGLNAGLAQAQHELVVFVHQDVYLPKGWPARLRDQWRRAQMHGGPIGIAGVFGVLDRKVPFDAIGRVVHRDRLLMHRDLPADVDGLDELLMVLPRRTPLRVDESLGWHLYGTDLALQAGQQGLRVVVVDAPCHHNTLTGRVPWRYRESERVLARKWRSMLPIHTNLSSIDAWLLAESAHGASPAASKPHKGGQSPSEPEETGQPAAIAELVTRLRREQSALGAELEQARLQVASMRASPFWRAREVFASVRDRIRGH